jgi:hypothetical protein
MKNSQKLAAVIGICLAVVVARTSLFRTEKEPLVQPDAGVPPQPSSERVETQPSLAEPLAPVLHTPKLTITEPTLPSAAIAEKNWEIGNFELRDNTANRLNEQIERAETLKDEKLRKELASIAGDLEDLAQLLRTKIGRTTTNVSPPQFRPDGTPYPAEGVFSGMSPNAVRDPERRQAYIEKLRENQVIESKRAWLVATQKTHIVTYSKFSGLIRKLMKEGTIPSDEGQKLIEQAKEKRDEK